MRALSDKEAVAMTLIDLAQGYQAKYGMQDGSFILMCCDTALKYFPKYINAMLLKAELLTELYKRSEEETKKKQELFSQMTELYANIHKLGYRKMPQQMYANWLMQTQYKQIDDMGYEEIPVAIYALWLKYIAKEKERAEKSKMPSIFIDSFKK
jgi:hypothetical protein